MASKMGFTAIAFCCRRGQLWRDKTLRFQLKVVLGDRRPHRIVYETKQCLTASHLWLVCGWQCWRNKLSTWARHYNQGGDSCNAPFLILLSHTLQATQLWRAVEFYGSARVGTTTLEKRVNISAAKQMRWSSTKRFNGTGEHHQNFSRVHDQYTRSATPNTIRLTLSFG